MVYMPNPRRPLTPQGAAAMRQGMQAPGQATPGTAMGSPTGASQAPSSINQRQGSPLPPALPPQPPPSQENLGRGPTGDQYDYVGEGLWQSTSRGAEGPSGVRTQPQGPQPGTYKAPPFQAMDIGGAVAGKGGDGTMPMGGGGMADLGPKQPGGGFRGGGDPGTKPQHGQQGPGYAPGLSPPKIPGAAMAPTSGAGQGPSQAQAPGGPPMVSGRTPLSPTGGPGAGGGAGNMPDPAANVVKDLRGSLVRGMSYLGANAGMGNLTPAGAGQQGPQPAGPPQGHDYVTGSHKSLATPASGAAEESTAGNGTGVEGTNDKGKPPGARETLYPGDSGQPAGSSVGGAVASGIAPVGSVLPDGYDEGKGDSTQRGDYPPFGKTWLMRHNGTDYAWDPNTGQWVQYTNTSGVEGVSGERFQTDIDNRWAQDSQNNPTGRRPQEGDIISFNGEEYQRMSDGQWHRVGRDEHGNPVPTGQSTSAGVGGGAPGGVGGQVPGSAKTPDERAREEARAEFAKALEGLGGDVKGLDPKVLEQMIQAERRQRAYDESKTMRASMEQAATVGASPEAASAAMAEMQQKGQIAGGQIEANQRMQAEQMNLQASLAEYQQRAEKAMAMANFAKDDYERQAALKAAQILAGQSEQAQRRLMELQAELSRPSVGEMILGGFSGILGGLGGGLGGAAGRYMFGG